MNAQTFVPEPDLLPLPATPFLLTALLILTLLLHLLAMNALVGGLAITLWHRWRSPGSNAVAGDPAVSSDARIQGAGVDLAALITKAAPILVAATVTLGVAPLLFLQALYGQFFFTSSVIMGWSWFSVIVTLCLAYYGTYLLAFRGPKLGAARTPILVVTLALFAWIAFVYTNNTTLMLRPDRWPALYFGAPGGTSLNLGDAQVFPRWLHMMAGAVAVGGLMLAWWGRAREGYGDATGALMRRQGLNAFFWITMANIGLGLIFVLTLRSEVQRFLMGGDTVATALLAFGFILGIALIPVAARARRSDDGSGLTVLTILLIVTLVTMILTRHVVRGAYLRGLYQPAQFPVQTQVFNLALFAALLGGGLTITVWMVRRFHRAASR